MNIAKSYLSFKDYYNIEKTLKKFWEANLLIGTNLTILRFRGTKISVKTSFYLRIA